jgi:hypothetical protein
MPVGLWSDVTAGTAYFLIDLIWVLTAGAGSETASSAAFAKPPEQEA